jgi:hypothetical protein
LISRQGAYTSPALSTHKFPNLWRFPAATIGKICFSITNVTGFEPLAIMRVGISCVVFAALVLLAKLPTFRATCHDFLPIFFPFFPPRELSVAGHADFGVFPLSSVKHFETVCRCGTEPIIASQALQR